MSFAKDSVRTFIIRFFLIFINLIAGIINARWLGPEGVGLFALFNLINIFSFRFGNLGFGSGFAFFTAKKKASSKELQNLAWLVGSVMSATSCIILLLFWKIKYSPWNDFPNTLFYLGLITIPLLYIKNYFRRILSGQLRIKIINIADVLQSFSYLPLAILFIVVLKLGIRGAVYSIITTQFISVIYLWCSLQSNNNGISHSAERMSELKLLLPIWRYSKWNYLIMFINFYLEQFPLLFLSYFFPKSIIGFYSIARGLVNRVWLMPQTFSQILFPFTAASEEDEAVQRTNMLSRHFLIIMGGISLILGIIAKPLITLLYGEAFINAAHVFYALLPTILLYPLTQFLTVHIAAFGNPKLAFFRSLLGAPGSFIFCFFLVPRYGAMGAALSLSATYILVSIINLIIYKKFTKTNLSSIIIPKKTDWIFYKRFIESIFSRNADNNYASKK